METVYFYSSWGGTIRIYKCVVIEPESRIFHPENSTKTLLGACLPGEVYNMSVWLEARDDERARQILIDYEEKALAKLEARIKAHKAKIKSLKKVKPYIVTVKEGDCEYIKRT